MKLLLALCAAAVVAAPVHADDAADLHALIDSDWQWRLHEFPIFSSLVGDGRYDDRLEDMSPENMARERAYHKERLARVQRINRAKLNAAQQLDYDIFERDARMNVADDPYPDELMPMDQLNGVYSELADLAQQLRFAKEKDYRDFLQRMHRFPKLVAQNIELMRLGIAKGVTTPKVLMAHVPELIDAQLAPTAEATPVWKTVFAELPPSIAPATRSALQSEARAALQNEIAPALRGLRRFVTEEYLPHARDTIARSALPDGKAWYAQLARRETTTELSPERIHQIGLDEVKRIRGEMMTVMRQTGFKGDLPAFMTMLRTDKRFVYPSAQALLMAARDVAKRIDPELPRIIRTLPRLTYGLIPAPSYSEKTAPTAQYNSGSLETGRAGLVWINTYDLALRPSWQLEALIAHEAAPGHHIQLALAEEQPAVQPFRRWTSFTAFVEGWGLYAESLGSEIGLYKDPYSRFGQLDLEMWRAVRLVVDTGMHALGWTRAQAIQFFADNSPRPRHDIEVEIDRYIAWPGQALAYKIGELKLKELRRYATQQLGAKFDVRDFHDFVLDSGAMPLDVLERRVHAWVEGQLAHRAHDPS